MEGGVVGRCRCRMDVFSFFCCGDMHRGNTADRIVGDGGLTGAVDRVAGGTTKGVVVARQVEAILPFVRAKALKIIGVEVRDDARRSCFGEVSDTVVRHADGRGYTVVVIFSAREITGVVVGVIGCDAARPNAARQFTVGGIGVARPL